MIKTCLTVFMTVMINSSILRVDEGEGEGEKQWSEGATPGEGEGEKQWPEGATPSEGEGERQ